MLLLLLISFLLRLAAGAENNATLPKQCSCGYRDPSTGELYTEAIIMYFNETGIDEDVFEVMQYAKRNQKGWNTIFRQGASPTNIMTGNNGSLPWQDAIDGTAPSLEMWLDGLRFDHLSDGAEFRSRRRDILYGSFRSSMRSAQPYVGGSAMSMFLKYNDSQSINMDMLNMDASNQARITQLINGEYPSYSLATNYTVIQRGDPPKIPPGQPWDFQDLRFDWMNDTIDFWIGNNKTRTATRSERAITMAPETLYFSHWSTGDINWMQGPPVNRSVANVRWIRAFFNSSDMSIHDHITYDQKCDTAAACSTEDITLRGSSGFAQVATKAWKPPMPHERIRVVAGYIAAAFSFFGVFALVNALIRRGPLHKLKNIGKTPLWSTGKQSSTQKLRQSLRHSFMGGNSGLQAGRAPQSGSETPAPDYTGRHSSNSEYPSGTATPLPAYESRQHSPKQSTHSLVRPKRSAMSLSARSSSQQHLRSPGSAYLKAPSTTTSEPLTPPFEHPPVLRTAESVNEEEEELETDARTYSDLAGEKQDVGEKHDVDEKQEVDEIKVASSSSSQSSVSERRSADEKKQATTTITDLDVVKEDKSRESAQVPTAPQDESALKAMKVKAVPDGMLGASTAEPSKEQKPQTQQPQTQPQQRIDYLAGSVVISCIFVTLRHFSLTFWPYVTEAQGPIMHFKADSWLAYILGPYFLTPFWIGPFFVTSCRFLAQRYLRTGKLNDIANKMLLRAPRMLIPCFVFMTLEYFLLSLGLTAKLEWLPSVSYSTWPYTVPQPNFGVFLNEIIELAYIIPNAAPEIINHYCVGVLWTIPVQLQFSFVTLLATVLIKDIKRPWKRMAFYTVTIIAGWYATSWSACHWAGLLLADADITYGWIKWTQARWYRLYPILFLTTVITIASPLVLLFNADIFSWSFMSWENAIHPDPTTGRPILSTVSSIFEAYPAYNDPSLAVLTFSVGLQIIVELSTWVQKALSIKLITFFHPHIMTIYLMHGFIFWSLGAYIAVSLSSLAVPYWAILLVTAVCCYSTIFILTIMVTPLIEFATKGSTKNIWRWATEEPVPHRATTAPFNKHLVVGRMTDEAIQGSSSGTA